MGIADNITALLGSDKCLDQWRSLLVSTQECIQSKYAEGKIKDADLVPVLLGPADKLKNLAALSASYPFLKDFSFIEYFFFEKTLETLMRHVSAPGRRKRGTDEDQVCQKKEDIDIIKESFLGLRYNQLNGQYQYLKEDKNGKRVWYATRGDDLDLLHVTLAVEHNFSMTRDRAIASFKYAAKANPYEPQVEMLNQCRRLHPNLKLVAARNFLATVGEFILGPAKNEPTIAGRSLRNIYMERWFVSMANLARNPGKTPQWMPILVGKQGSGKSQMCRHLIPDEFNSELFAQITTPIDTLKKEPFQLHCGFVLEWSEIDEKFKSDRDTEPLKNLITTDVDRCRKPYMQQQEELIRRFGFIGTTNRCDLFRDSTGQRRFLPLTIDDDFELPWVAVKEGLNTKIWAAADIIAQTYQGNERELFGFSAEEQEFLSHYQKDYAQEDPWESPIFNFARENRMFTTAEVLTAIGVSSDRQNQTSSRKVTDLLKKMFEKNVAKAERRRAGVKARYWIISDEVKFSELPRSQEGPVALDEFVKEQKLKSL